MSAAKSIFLGLILVGLAAASALFGADAPLLKFSLAGFFLTLAAIYGVMLGFEAMPVETKSIAAMPGVFWWGILAIMALALPELVQGRISTAAPELAVLGAASAIFLITRNLALTTLGANRALLWGSAVLLGIAILAFVDFAANPAAIFGQEKAYHQNRLSAFFLSANTAATLFAASSVLGLAGVLRALDRGRAKMEGMLDALAKEGLLPILLLIFSVTCLVLTGSRAGILIAGFALIMLSVWGRLGRGQSKNALFLVAGIVVASVVVALISGQVIGERLGQLQTDGTGRGVLYPACVAAWQNALWFGHGLDQFSVAMAGVTTEQTAAVLVQQGAAHNIVLQWLIQSGVWGVFWGGSLIAALLWHLRSGLARRRRLHTPLRAIILIVMVFLVHGLADYALEIPALVWWLAFLSGIGSGIVDGHTERTDKRA